MHRPSRRRALVAVTATAACASPLLAPVAAQAQPTPWPSKPLRLIVPLLPRAPADPSASVPALSAVPPV